MKQSLGVILTEQNATPKHNVGDVHFDEKGRRYVYGSANGATDAGALCAYVPGTFDFTEKATTGGTPGTNWFTVGWACAAMTDNYYGWYFTGGGDFEALVENSFAAADLIYTTSTAGVIGTNSSSFVVEGVKNVDTGATDTRVTIFALNPITTIGLIAASD